MLVNGNNINGEIMGMSRGKLDLKTDDAGRLSIEWLKVVRVTSSYTYEVETTSGNKRYSALLAPDGGERGVVQLHDGTRIPVSEIVSLVPIDATFFSRLSAYFDLGFTLAKANDALTRQASQVIATARQPTVAGRHGPVSGRCGHARRPGRRPGRGPGHRGRASGSAGPGPSTRCAWLLP
jgi:hypothetical protein